MKRIFVFIMLSVFLSCAHTIKVSIIQPKIGDSMPCNPPKDQMWMISSAQLARGCDIIFDGIKYFVATIDGKTIYYVSTNDPKFKSPEGIHVGSKYTDVQNVNGSEIFEDGWACQSRLPSGWYVKYGMGPRLFEVSKDSTVWELFTRK